MLSPFRRKLTLAALSTVLSATVAAIWVVPRLRTSQGGNVVAVETRADLTRLLTERASGVGAADGGSGTGASDTSDLARTTPLDHDTARRFFPTVDDPTCRYVEHGYFVRKPHLSIVRPWREHRLRGFVLRTNDLGMREDQDVRTDEPHFRVVLTGDSHMEGVCANEESLTNVLEQRLAGMLGTGAVEALNAAVGGYNVYNYVGTLERLQYLAPEVFVVVLYGGNDFVDVCQMQRYFAGRGPWTHAAIPAGPRLEAWHASGEVRHQETRQVDYFLSNPDDVIVAIDTTNALLRRMALECRAASIELVVAYLPPPLATQREFYEEAYFESLRALECTDEDIHVSDRIADGIVEFLRAAGIRHVDLRPLVSSAQEPLYWYKDFHLNTRGHTLCAEALLPTIAALATTSSGERLRPVDVEELPQPPAPVETLAAPGANEAAWTLVGEGVEHAQHEGRGLVIIPSRSTPALVRVALLGERRTVTRVELVLMTDGAFEVRAALGGRTSAILVGDDTQRLSREFELDLGPPASALADGAEFELVVEFLQRATPVVLEEIRLFE